MTAPLIRAAQELLDAYGGAYPDWILPEAVALAQALAVERAEFGPVNHWLAAIEHMRLAMAHLRQAGDARNASALAAIQNSVDRAAARAMPATVEREAQRLANMPDPVPVEDESDGE